MTIYTRSVVTIPARGEMKTPCGYWEAWIEDQTRGQSGKSKGEAVGNMLLARLAISARGVLYTGLTVVELPEVNPWKPKAAKAKGGVA